MVHAIEINRRRRKNNLSRDPPPAPFTRLSFGFPRIPRIPFAFPSRSRREASIIEHHTERKENSWPDGSGDVVRGRWCSATRCFNVRRHDDRGPRINSLVPNPLATVVVQSSIVQTVLHLLYDSRNGSVHQPSGKTMKLLLLALCSLLALAAAQPAKNDLWKGSSMDQMVDQTKIECAQKNDEVSCMKFKVLNLLDQIFRKDSFKASVGPGSGNGSMITFVSKVSNLLLVFFIRNLNRRCPKRWR